MAAKGKPTKSFLDHLDDREGNIDKSYLDSLGKLTGGIGHLLLEDEINPPLSICKSPPSNEVGENVQPAISFPSSPSLNISC